MLSAAQAAGLSKRVIFAGALVLAGIAILYRDVVPELIHAWSTDDNYSHGYLIPPIAAYLAWERRQLFLSAPIRPSAFGLIVILGSVLVLALGILGIVISEVFAQVALFARFLNVLRHHGALLLQFF